MSFPVFSPLPRTRHDVTFLPTEMSMVEHVIWVKIYIPSIDIRGLLMYIVIYQYVTSPRNGISKTPICMNKDRMTIGCLK